MKRALLFSVVLLAGTVWGGTDGWIQLSGMQTARDQFAGCVIGDAVYVFGGNDPTGSNLFSGEKYVISAGRWSSIADNPHYQNPWSVASGVEELTGVTLDGKFYVFGAYGGSEDPSSGYYGVFNYNQMYDPVTDTWTTLAEKPTTTASAPAIVYGEEIFIFGGYYTDDGGAAGTDREGKPKEWGENGDAVFRPVMEDYWYLRAGVVCLL